MCALAQLALVSAVACAPVVRDAAHEGARDMNAEASLRGPFDGRITDANTGEPLADALVIGIWSHDRGQGFAGPAGSIQRRTTTDQAGRYRLAQLHEGPEGDGILTSFKLVVYKRGYRAHRSDRLFGGAPRRDFAQRHNEVKLEKWRAGDSHAQHLIHLTATRDLAAATRWERERANLDLYRALGGESAVPAAHEGGPALPVPKITAEPTPAMWLDAAGLITLDEVATRTGSYAEFSVGDLADLPRTEHYHGVHHRALDAEATSDFAYRVWKSPPEGMDGVAQTFAANLPGVEVSGEVTERTWLLENDELRAVAFIDDASETGILVTCGVELCVDLETAIILAKLMHGRLDRLSLVPAGEDANSETALDDAQQPGNPQPQ